MTVSDVLDMLEVLREQDSGLDGFLVLANDALSRTQAEILDVMIDRHRGTVLLELNGRLS